MELLYIRQILAGDVAKYSYFIDSYKDDAFAVAIRIVKNRKDAEEVVQDAFYKAYKTLSQFRGDARFSTWLFRIVVNTALNKIRKRLPQNKELDSVPLSDDPAEEVASSYNKLAQKERVKYINEALNGLKMEDALILTLYYLQELNVNEIADVTSIPAANIKMQIHRARKKMYHILSRILEKETKNLLS